MPCLVLYRLNVKHVIFTKLFHLGPRSETDSKGIDDQIDETDTKETTDHDDHELESAQAAAQLVNASPASKAIIKDIMTPPNKDIPKFVRNESAESDSEAVVKDLDFAIDDEGMCNFRRS